MSGTGCERRRDDISIGWVLIQLAAWFFAGLVGWMLCEIKLDKQAADAVKDRPYLELTEVNSESK